MMNPRMIARFVSLIAVFALTFGRGAQAQSVVYEQPPSPSGGLIVSSWVDPNGTDADMYCYDDFTLSSSQSITEVHWRGGYVYGAPYGMVSNFTITFYASIAGGSHALKRLVVIR